MDKDEIIQLVKVHPDTDRIQVTMMKPSKTMQVLFVYSMDIAATGDFVAQLNQAIQQIHERHAAKLPLKIRDLPSGRSHA